MSGDDGWMRPSKWGFFFFSKSVKRSRRILTPFFLMIYVVPKVRLLPFRLQTWLGDKNTPFT